MPFQRSFRESHRPFSGLSPNTQSYSLQPKAVNSGYFYRKYILNKALLNSGVALMFGTFENCHRDRFDLKPGFRSNYVAYVSQVLKNRVLDIR